MSHAPRTDSRSTTADAPAPSVDPRRRLGSRLLTVALVVVVALVTAYLAYQRFQGGMGQRQYDLQTYFLPAARALLEGRSVYGVEGYFYSPLVAILLAPLSGPYAAQLWTALTIAAALATAVIATIAFTPSRPFRERVVLTGIAVVTMLSSWPATIEYFLGQTNMLVAVSLAACVLSTSRGRRMLGGFWLGVAAMVKTWPALIVVWLLRRGARGRGREAIGVAIAAAVTIVMIVVLTGPSGLLAAVTGPVSGSEQQLVAYSVWGVPRILFSDQSIAHPVLVSPVVRWTTCAVLVVMVAALAVVALVRPGPAEISLYNVVFLTILLLPVSHFAYLTLPLPALWWWVSRVLRDRRDVLAWVIAALLAVWWVVVFRLPPDGDGTVLTSWPSIVRIFSATLIAAGSSIVGALLWERRRRRLDLGLAPIPAETRTSPASRATRPA